MWPYIVMGSPQQNSGAFFGFNFQNAWSAHQKGVFNIADTGTQWTYNLANVNLISDNDVFDISNTDDDFIPSTW